MSTPRRPRPIEIGPLRASTLKRWRAVEGGVQWYWRARRKGERDDVWTGWGTRPEVQKRLATLVADGVPQRTRREQVEVGTLGDLLDAWMDRQRERPDLAANTVKFYDKAARHLVAWVREVDVRRVDRDTLERYRDHRLREGASRRLVAQELKILNMAWRWGMECNHVPARLLPRVKVLGDDNDFVINHRTPSPAEVARVLEQLDGDAQVATRLLATTGARVSEVCRLSPDDLDLRTGELQLRGKTGLRSFPLPPGLVSVLAERCTSDRERLLDLPKSGSQVLRDRIARACSAAGVPVFTPHGLRRMVVDRMARGGVDVATAASLTGHSAEVMLRYYRKVTDEDRRKAVAAAKLAEFHVPGEVIQGPWATEGSS